MKACMYRNRVVCTLCVLLLATLLPLGRVSSLAAQGITPADEIVPSNRKPTILRRQRLDNNTINTLIPLPATQDTYVASNRPGSNFGGSDTLSMGNTRKAPTKARCACCCALISPARFRIAP